MRLAAVRSLLRMSVGQASLLLPAFIVGHGGTCKLLLIDSQGGVAGVRAFVLLRDGLCGLYVGCFFCYVADVVLMMNMFFSVVRAMDRYNGGPRLRSGHMSCAADSLALLRRWVVQSPT